MKRNPVRTLLASLTVLAFVASDLSLLAGAAAQQSPVGGQIPGFGSMNQGTSSGGSNGGGYQIPSYTVP